MKEQSQYIEAIEPHHEGASCGPASLEIALRAVGVRVDQSEIAMLVEDVNEGLSWEEMRTMAHVYG